MFGNRTVHSEINRLVCHALGIEVTDAAIPESYEAALKRPRALSIKSPALRGRFRCRGTTLERQTKVGRYWGRTAAGGLTRGLDAVLKNPGVTTPISRPHPVTSTIPPGPRVGGPRVPSSQRADEADEADQNSQPRRRCRSRGQ